MLSILREIELVDTSQSPLANVSFPKLITSSSVSKEKVIRDKLSVRQFTMTRTLMTAAVNWYCHPSSVAYARY